MQAQLRHDVPEEPQPWSRSTSAPAVAFARMFAQPGPSGWIKKLPWILGYVRPVRPVFPNVPMKRSSLCNTGSDMDAATIVLTAVFLFLVLRIPCCASDIVFPLLFTKEPVDEE